MLQLADHCGGWLGGWPHQCYAITSNRQRTAPALSGEDQINELTIVIAIAVAFLQR